MMILVGSVGSVHEGRDVEQGMRQEAGTLRSTGGMWRVCTSVRSTALNAQSLHSIVF